MVDLIDVLKSRARILHRNAAALEPGAVARVRKHVDSKETGDDMSELQRRHCLTVVAKELGFSGWSHAAAVFAGRPVDDFGTLLYPTRGGEAFWNVWSASYAEARRIRQEHGGYLLAYKRHFFIVDRYFIENLGLDPEDDDWARIKRDWVRPGDLAARNRLYSNLLRSRD